MKKTILITLISISGLSLANAQTDSVAEPPNKAKGGAEKFFLAGKASTQWESDMLKGSPSSHSFFPGSLMLMPLVKINDKFFLDAQIEVSANTDPGASGTSVSLNELIVYYRLCPDVSAFFGNFSPKYGLFLGVLDDFTNRYCTDPIGMARGPQTQTGFGLQGGIQAGYSKLNYQVYLANGPQLIVDSTTLEGGNSTGLMSYDAYRDNNNNKAIGGSLGFLPFSNSCLQVDFSGQYAAKTGNTGSTLESIHSTSWAADLNYYHTFSPITVRVLAEYNNTQTQNANYPLQTSDTTSISYLFNNKLSGWFCGASFRASGINNLVLRNFELGGRIGAYNPSKDAPWGGNAINQTTVCLTYWFTWKTPLNFAYDILTQTGSPTQSSFTAKITYFF
jgi:hypothetical protein